MNAAAAYLAAIARARRPDPAAVLAGLAGFAGARRRFEARGEADGVRVVDDYAHNPAKVARRRGHGAEVAPGRAGRLVVVFQPHLYSRTRDFADALRPGAARRRTWCVVLDVYGAREDPLPGRDRVAGRRAAARPARRGIDLSRAPSLVRPPQA